MKASTIILSEEDRVQLKKLSKEYMSNWQIAKRLEAIRLLSNDLTVATVSKQLCVNQEIIYSYIKTYREKGFAGLVNLEKPGRESKLTEEQMVEIEKYITDCRVKKVKFTTQEQARWVKERFGVDIGAKWLYKRLLIRKQHDLDYVIKSVLMSLSLVGNGLVLNPLYRRMFFRSLHLLMFSSAITSTKL